MGRPSSVDQLPEEIRERIGQLRGEGHTIDEIMAALGELDAARISRSALGRHLKSMEAVGRRMRQSREVANALVRELGSEPASRTARLNIELLQSSMLELQLKMADGDVLDPKAIMELGRAVQALTTASRQDVELVKQIEMRATARAKLEAAEDVAKVGREQGLSSRTLDAIKARILGVKPPEPLGL